jgi:hypothetical protein
MKFFAAIFLAALNLSAQTINLTATNSAASKTETNRPPAIQRAEQIRAECLAGRRIICGKILKVLPDGLVVDSGYTDLLRAPLNSSWLIPGSVTASRPAGLIESREPGSACVGMVFLTNLPRSHGDDAKPRLYDYVVVLGYPEGQFTYNSVGTVQKTVRQFSANLIKAVNADFEAAENPGAASGAK